MGLKSVLIFGPDSLRRAIRKAAWLFRMAQFEQEKSAHLASALRHLDLGVLAVDTEERIQSVNPALQRLLGTAAAGLIGRRLSTVAPELSLARVIETGFEERDVVQRIGSAAVVTSRVPIREHGVLRGAILTCLEGSAIQRLERGLRSEHRPPLFVPRYSLEALVGGSPEMERVRALSRRYARTDATVLITGRERHRQGDGGPGDPRGEPPARGALRRDQLRRLPRVAARVGALRLRGGGLHRLAPRRAPRGSSRRPTPGRSS